MDDTSTTATREALRPGALLPLQSREAKIRAEDIDDRSVELVFSTESPVERYYGDEVLVHEKRCMRLDRINTAAPLLVNHDPDDQVGVVEFGKLDRANKVGRAKVRFSSSARAEEILRDVRDEIRQLVSFAYRVHRTEVQQRDGQPDLVRVTDWEPYEISIVSIPADTKAGVGRSDETDHEPVEVVVSGAAVPEAVAPVGEEQTTEAERNDAPAKPNRPTITTMSDENEDAPKPDFEAERKKIRDEERQRAINYDKQADSIAKLARNGQLNADQVDELIRKHRETDYDAEGLKSEVLEALGDPKNVRIAKPVGMAAKEITRYSLTRAIMAQTDPKKAFDGLEREMHDEVARTSPRPSEGFFVPYEISLHQRAIAASSGSEGNETVATEVGDLIELLRDALVIEQLGATRLSGLTSNVQLPRHTATATSAWDAETDDLTESSQTFDTITLSPKRAGVTTYYSKQLLIQSSLDVEAFVRRDQAEGLARTIQKGVLYGSGASDQPTGLTRTTDVNTFTFGGAATYADYVDAWEQVATANGEGGRMGYLTTPAAAEKGLTIFIDAGSGRTIIEGTPGGGFSVLGFPLLTTTTLDDAADSNLLAFGNWQELIWATFGNGMDVVVDPYTRAKSAQVVVTTNVFMDAAVRHPKAFTISTDSAAQ